MSEKLQTLIEIGECNGFVDDDQYSDIERRWLRELATEGFVALAWRLTPRGKNHLTQSKAASHD